MVCVLDDKVEICMWVGGSMGQELPEPSIFVFFYQIKKKVIEYTLSDDRSTDDRKKSLS